MPAAKRTIKPLTSKVLWHSDLYVTVALPVTMRAFTATCEATAEVLDWVTQTERNNDYFTAGIISELRPAQEATSLPIGYLPKGVFMFEFSSEKMRALHKVMLK